MAYSYLQLFDAFTRANNGVVPTQMERSALEALAIGNQGRLVTDAAVVEHVLNSAQDDVQVAVQAYQFFTGKIPTKAGLDFLTNSAANPADLNDPYYAQFNLENRYINFAANLGLNGEGAGQFAALYGQMDFATFVGSAYESIIGAAWANAAKIDPAAAVRDVISRQAAFTQTARERGLINASSTAAQVDLAARAAVVGYLMAEGVKADFGIYANGANNFVNAMIASTAVHDINLLTEYSPLGKGLPSSVPGLPGETPQYRFTEAMGAQAVGGVFSTLHLVFGLAVSAAAPIRADGSAFSVVLNGGAAPQAPGVAFTATAQNGFDAKGAVGGALFGGPVDFSTEAQLIAAIGRIANESAGEEAYFVLTNASLTLGALYHWTSVVPDNAATAGELALLGTVVLPGVVSSSWFTF